MGLQGMGSDETGRNVSIVQLPERANARLLTRRSLQLAIHFVTRAKARFLHFAYFVPAAMLTQGRRQNLPSFDLKPELCEKLCFAGPVTVSRI